MKSTLSKTRVIINFITLTGYLIMLVLGTFHYHNFFYYNSLAFNARSTSNITHQPNFNGSEHECIIHQNLLSVQTALSDCVPNGCRLNLVSRISKSSSVTNQSSSEYLTYTSLRAPPKIS